eukprot:5872056-Pyramimonas_sp.AAC.2
MMDTITAAWAPYRRLHVGHYWPLLDTITAAWAPYRRLHIGHHNHGGAHHLLQRDELHQPAHNRPRLTLAQWPTRRVWQETVRERKLREPSGVW